MGRVIAVMLSGVEVVQMPWFLLGVLVIVVVLWKVWVLVCKVEMVCPEIKYNPLQHS